MIYGLEKYTLVDNKETFNDINNLERFNIDIKKFVINTASVKEFAEYFHLSTEEVYDKLVKKFCNQSIFMFSTYDGDNSILIKEKAAYIEKYSRKERMKVKHYFNVYLSISKWINLCYSELGMIILKEKFPQIFENKLFLKESNKYPQTIKEITKDKKLSDIYYSLRDELTCGDIVEILTNPDAINEKIYKPKFEYYYYPTIVHNNVYLELQDITVHNTKYTYSLYIPLEAFFNKDWSLVENHNVYSIIKPDANKYLGSDYNNFYMGKQCNAPYFNHPLVNAFKECLTK